MPRYRIYGLSIDSTVELRPLQSVEALDCDVTIRRGEVNPEGIDNPRVERALVQVDTGVAWINVPGVARFLVREGNIVTVEEYAGAVADTVRLYLLGTVMGAVLHQRGYLVLHASAIQVEDKVVLFAGASGSGKSTTAAAMHAEGYPVLSDDVVAIDREGRVVGFPHMKLWVDSLTELNVDSAPLEQIRDQTEKFYLPIHDRVESCSSEISAIYILMSDNDRSENSYELDQLQGLDKFRVLRRHTYRRFFPSGLGLNKNQLELLSILADKIDVVRLYRPTISFDLDSLVSLLLSDMNERLKLSVAP